MKPINPVLLFAFALSLAACGGKNLSVDLTTGGGGDTNDLEFVFPPGAVEHQLPFRISGGIPPYDSRVDACPHWVTLFPDQGVLAGARPPTITTITSAPTSSPTPVPPGGVHHMGFVSPFPHPSGAPWFCLVLTVRRSSSAPTAASCSRRRRAVFGHTRTSSRVRAGCRRACTSRSARVC